MTLWLYISPNRSELRAVHTQQGGNLYIFLMFCTLRSIHGLGYFFIMLQSPKTDPAHTMLTQNATQERDKRGVVQNETATMNNCATTAFCESRLLPRPCPSCCPHITEITLRLTWPSCATTSKKRPLDRGHLFLPTLPLYKPEDVHTPTGVPK